MISAAIASAVHLLALAIGAASIFLRARALGGTLDREGIERAMRADNWWGIASILWVGSGVLRLFWLEKSTAFFLRNGFFWVKMSLFATAMVLEMWPMITFIGWRVTLAKGDLPDTRRAALFRKVSLVELAIILAIPFAAASMARGLW